MRSLFSESLSISISIPSPSGILLAAVNAASHHRRRVVVLVKDNIENRQCVAVVHSTVHPHGISLRAASAADG